MSEFPQITLPCQRERLRQLELASKRGMYADKCTDTTPDI